MNKDARTIGKIRKFARVSMNRDEIAEELGITYNRVVKYISDNKIYLPRRPTKEVKKRAEIVQLATRGPFTISSRSSLEKIGKKVGLTRERVREVLNEEKIPYQAIKETAEYWRREHLSTIVGLIDYYKSQRVKGAGWPYEKALEYWESTPNNPNRISFGRLVNLFQERESAEKRRENLSLREFEERTGITSVHVGHIFTAMNIDPMHENPRYSEPSKATKEAIMRAFYVDMNTRDLAYFLFVHEDMLRKYWRKTGMGDRKRKPTFAHIFIGENRLCYARLTNRQASQTYQAYDVGFTPREISEDLLDTTKNIVDFTLKNRKKLREPIIDALRMLYPDQRITANRPYVNWNVER